MSSGYSTNIAGRAIGSTPSGKCAVAAVAEWPRMATPCSTRSRWPPKTAHETSGKELPMPCDCPEDQPHPTPSGGCNYLVYSGGPHGVGNPVDHQGLNHDLLAILGGHHLVRDGERLPGGHDHLHVRRERPV